MNKINLYINRTENQYGGGVVPGQEDVEWPDYDDTICEYEYHCATFKIPDSEKLWCSWLTESVSAELYEVLKNCKNIYLSIVVYSTGDTFSHTEGKHHIVGISPTEEDAKKSLDYIELLDYQPWDGYFERLTNKIVVKLPLK